MKKKFVLGFVLCLMAAVSNAQVTAVVSSIGANKNLVMGSGIEDVALTIQSISSDKFNTLDEVSKIKNFILNELSKDFPFTIVPESDALANENYQTYVKETNAKGLLALSKVATEREVPEGYLTYPVNPAEVLGYFNGANAVMSINVSISLEPTVLINKNGSAKAKIYVTIELVNPKSKSLMRISAAGTSEQSFGILAGQIVKNRDNIPSALVEASDDLFKEMREKLPKAIKKFEKKLEKYK
ncbi:MAG: hypothetical protein LBN27_13080 [Prevotellaceae bacterium]|jgi:hypothetical protein|nr:hypothetical protein [Prevotellaceae bacterium]